jgi:hypothetical protein
VVSNGSKFRIRKSIRGWLGRRVNASVVAFANNDSCEAWNALSDLQGDTIPCKLAEFVVILHR